MTMPAPFFGMARSRRWPSDAADGLDAADAGNGGERTLQGFGFVGGDAHGDRAVIGHAAHQVLGGAVGDDAALVDHDGARADGLDLFEDVRGDDDGLLLGHLGDELAHLVLLVGIEPVGGLVHDQHLGVVEDRLGDADAALVALGQGLDRLLEHRTETGPLDRQAHRPGDRIAPQAPQLGDEAEQALGRHLGVERRALGQIAEPLPGLLGLVLHVEAGDARPARRPARESP